MAITPGTHLGVYEVSALIGEGGMGQVYRARDTKLGRDVALKTLPDSFASDPDRMARFTREAQTLAALNHPNIAHIHGLEESGGLRALVMELVEGEDLARRIARGAIPIEEALPIAHQIAEALEAAHEQGIIHRDLKPANIKVRDDGTVKILDFGLAKATEPAAVSSLNLSMSPTLTTPAMTAIGMILGTAAYMSPEQARGKVVDKRTDIWAFGVVLYEMLTGRRAFEDEDVSLTLSKVLQREPDFDALPSVVPARVVQVLRVCLRKDSKRRLGDIRDARLALEGAFETATPPSSTTATVRAPAADGRLGWALAGILFVAAAGLSVPAIRYFGRALPEAAAVRFEVDPPAGLRLGAGSAVQLSPDARRLAFIARSPGGDGGLGMYVRALDETAARRLTGAEASQNLFWSADSESVAYFSDGKLKRVSASGGPSQVLCTLPTGTTPPFAGTWGSEGVILFSAVDRASSAIFRVPAAGGQPVALTPTGSASGRGAGEPVFLPDGRHYLAVARGDDGLSAFVGSVDSTQRQPLPGVTGSVKYASAGYLVFVRDGSLVAQRFDADRRQLSGDVMPIAERVTDSNEYFSVSTTGALAYRTTGAAPSSQLVWFDRAGTRLRVEPMTGSLQAPSLTRDGKRLAIERTDASGTHVWVIDLERGTSTLLSDDSSVAKRPVFSPDGSQVAFSRDRINGEGGTIYRKSSSGTGPEERVAEGELTDWSPDGRFISFIQGSDLWAQPLTGDRTPILIAATKGNDRRGRFSPDGRWVAYESDFSGRFEIYVQRFPPTAERIQVSANGGSSAYWRSDGEELFFSTPDRKIMAVEVTPGSTFHASPPHTVFEVPGFINNGRFAVTPDGQQFLVPLQTESAASEPITVILNWASGLRK